MAGHPVDVPGTLQPLFEYKVSAQLNPAGGGYGWMGLASFKLIASDLDRADTPLRALAFLGVGGIGMAAAILANRKRSGVPS